MSDRTDRQAVITGMGMVTPIGDDAETVADAFASGHVGFCDVEDETLTAAGMTACQAAPIQGFDPLRYLGSGNIRPLDRAARLAASAAALGLESSGWRADGSPLGDAEIGLVLGTMFGSVHTISAFDLRAQIAGPNYAKPLDFANSVINAAAGQTAIWHGLRGVNSTVAGGATAGLEAISTAAELIHNGRIDHVLAGGADELAIEAWVGFARAGLAAAADERAAHDVNTSAAGPPFGAVPFGRDRRGFVLGEGAVLLALEPQAVARQRGARIWARVAGHGTAFDPSQGRDIVSQAAALSRAMTSALDAASFDAAAIDLVSTSASGDPSRDAAEALAIANTIDPSVPIMAVKANVGECLGMAGALQVAAALALVHRGVIPGITGLTAPDEAIALRNLSANLQQRAVRNLMVTTLGFDGKAEVLVLERDASDRGDQA